MLQEGRLVQGPLGGFGEGDPFSYVAVALGLGVVAYMMWRLLRDELPPKSRIEWVRLISIVVAGAGAILGILGLAAAFSFSPVTGGHVALLGSALFFAGFLVALISLTVDMSAKMRGQ